MTTHDNALHTGMPQLVGVGWIKKLIIAALVAGLTGLVQPAAAQAVIIQGPNQVGFGRAALLFNRAETQKIGFGVAPGGIPPSNPAGAAFLAARMGIAAISMTYYNRGLCSAYLWSVRPWDNQGFMSRKC